jgi:WD40 repeat protein
MLKLQANNELHRDNRPCQLLLKSRTTRLKQLSPSSKSTAPTLHLSLNRKNIISTTITSINLLTSSLKTFSVPHHHAAVSGIEWFHDIGIFTTIGGDNKLKIWDTSTLQMAHEFKLLFPLDKHSWSESGLIAAGGKTASITILDPNIGAASHTLHGHSLGVRSLSWSPIVDHILASGG